MTLLEIYDEYTCINPINRCQAQARVRRLSLIRLIVYVDEDDGVCAYLAATSSGRFPLPASVLGTTRNFLLKTAAISYCIHARESLPRCTSS